MIIYPYMNIQVGKELLVRSFSIFSHLHSFRNNTRKSWRERGLHSVLDSFINWYIYHFCQLNQSKKLIAHLGTCSMWPGGLKQNVGQANFVMITKKTLQHPVDRQFSVFLSTLNLHLCPGYKYFDLELKD